MGFARIELENEAPVGTKAREMTGEVAVFRCKLRGVEPEEERFRDGVTHEGSTFTPVCFS